MKTTGRTGTGTGKTGHRHFTTNLSETPVEVERHAVRNNVVLMVVHTGNSDLDDGNEVIALDRLEAETLAGKLMRAAKLRPSPIARIKVYLKRRAEDELTDDENDEQAQEIHEIFAGLPEVGPVAVCDRDGKPLYFADSREGEDDERCCGNNDTGCYDARCRCKCSLCRKVKP